MSFTLLPQFKVLPRTNLSQDYNHSILIAVLRGLAAVEVAAAHLRAQVFPGLKGMQDPALWYQALAFFTGFGHQAVVLFFLLSGWLVGGSFLNRLREPLSIKHYAVDRVTRLWIVLIPAFVLSLIIAGMTNAVDLGAVSFAPGNEYSAMAFVGNLFGFQETAVPRFAGNFPLWSLANETWYYVLFPLLAMSFCAKSTISRIAAAAMCMLIGVSLPGPIILYFSLWLLGAAFSRIQITASTAQQIGVACLWVGMAGYFRVTAGNDMLDAHSYFQHLIFSLPIMLLLSSLQTKTDPKRTALMRAKKVGDVLAGFSFTLYVIHIPLLVLLINFWSPLRAGRLSPYELSSLATYGIILAGILVAAYVFHLPFEAQTHRVRKYLKRKLFSTPETAPGQVESAV
ncbi:acyltransferase [Massilia sp. PAMC28688]|uniref:acyltransferase family protein n=1 Tax=Massilia sp. PAMC28688 TaxID=2861283 RepID=UPI001C63490E|nr:acyltransferase [Massilia sp. PAMC28688]QYF93084.1 acyltransferase [Massilia sp. PAMC28688]